MPRSAGRRGSPAASRRDRRRAARRSRPPATAARRSRNSASVNVPFHTASSSARKKALSSRVPPIISGMSSAMAGAAGLGGVLRQIIAVDDRPEIVAVEQAANASGRPRARPARSPPGAARLERFAAARIRCGRPRAPSAPPRPSAFARSRVETRIAAPLWMMAR